MDPVSRRAGAPSERMPAPSSRALSTFRDYRNLANRAYQERLPGPPRWDKLGDACFSMVGAYPVFWFAGATNPFPAPTKQSAWADCCEEVAQY